MRSTFLLSNKTYVYSKINLAGENPFAIFNEEEGSTFILTLLGAKKANINYEFPCRYLRLFNKTSLTEVGITSKVAKILAKESIPCNVVAALNYDYFFVPVTQAEKAKQLLNTHFLKT
jgi:hypothetical protein